MRSNSAVRLFRLLKQTAQQTTTVETSLGRAFTVGARAFSSRLSSASFRTFRELAYSPGFRSLSSSTLIGSGETSWLRLLKYATAFIGVPVAAAAIFHGNGYQFIVASADSLPSEAKVVIELPDGTKVFVVGPPAAKPTTPETPATPTPAIKKKIVIFEVEGGSDKGPDGHRKDSVPILNALKEKGWDCEIVFYADAEKDKIFEHVLATADAYISRINPGKYPTYTESKFFDMCKELIGQGVVPMPHPSAMVGYGAKDALVKIRDTPAGLPDTYAYYDVESFKKQFPASIAKNIRVLKQNRGSTGEGIWVIKPHGWTQGSGYKLTKDTLLECTEMVDNHTEINKLGDFMEFCTQYIVGENGMLVDQRFLPRIVEGEVRVLMIFDKPVSVVHKKPAEGQYSATLFSGAKYTYEDPSDPKWTALVANWLASMPMIKTTLGGYDYPLIWTGDFILDTDENGVDAYRLGEMNCSCVGFTTQLEFAKDVAEAAIRLVESKKA